MEFVIVGSGGCVKLPRPLCRCPVCEEARAKGAPYSRRGCSLYCADARLLVDTPEDIAEALDIAGIDAVDAIAYSHWDPDHTLGMRVVELLRLDWLALSENTFDPSPIRVMALDNVLRDVNAIGSKFGPFLDYYEHMRLIRREVVRESVDFGPIRLTLLPVDERREVTVFVFQKEEKRLVYAPCDVKPFPDHPLLQGADVLVIGNTIVGDTLRGGVTLSPANPLRDTLFSMDEILSLKERYGFGRVIVTHIEEDWGKSFDDYTRLEARYDGVSFAFDGMRIAL